jgi:hypothetical protein
VASDDLVARDAGKRRQMAEGQMIGGDGTEVVLRK